MIDQRIVRQGAKFRDSISEEVLARSLDKVLAAKHRFSEHNFSGECTVELPAATISITVKSSAPTIRKDLQLSQNQDNPESANQDGKKQSEIVPIENTNDLLGEALKRMPAKKQEEIISKATDEALRLQVKRKEGQLDQEMASNKLEDTIQAAQRLGEANAAFQYQFEQKSEHGSVSVKVQNKSQPLSQRVGGCFVATAAFGDFEHSNVIELRRFRDTYLRHTKAGRRMIHAYYTLGPKLADFIGPRHWARVLSRAMLFPAVVVVAAANRLR